MNVLGKKEVNLSIGRIYKIVIISFTMILIMGIMGNSIIRKDVINTIYLSFSENSKVTEVKIDDQLKSLDYILINRLSKDEKIDIICNTDSKIKRIYNINKMMKDFQDLQLSMDKSYNFFLYDDLNTKFFSYTNTSVSYNNRIEIEKEIAEYIDKLPRDNTNYRRWKAVKAGNDYVILRILYVNKIYLGCWIPAEKIIENFTSSALLSNSGFLVTEGKVISNVEEYKEIRNTEDLTIQEKELSKYTENNCFYLASFHNSDFQLLLSGTDFAIYKNYVSLLWTVILAVVLILLLGISLLILIQKFLIKPIFEFTNHLEKLSDDTSTVRYFKLKELQQVSTLFNRLVKQVKELRLSMYENELEKRQIEVGYLQEQIKPHFYINCLSIIFNMAQLKKYEDVQRISLQVSNYLRYTVKDGMALVTVEQEYEHVQGYLNIQNIRYESEFKYEIRIDPELKMRRIPPMAIQTLVENSIKHCIMMEKEILIRVSVYQQVRDNITYLVIEEADNGQGFPEEVLQRLNQGESLSSKEGQNIGISNLIKRLMYFYEGESEILFQNIAGAKIKIFIPYERT